MKGAGSGCCSRVSPGSCSTCSELQQRGFGATPAAKARMCYEVGWRERPMRACPFVALLAAVPGWAQEARPQRPVHTYSIVARDPQTGQMGVAVQSHWFSVGSVVPWAEAGVGAVATQSIVEPSYGLLGLELMRAGKTA